MAPALISRSFPRTLPLLWNNALFGYTVGDGAMDLSKDERDSAEYMPKSVVIDEAFSPKTSVFWNRVMENGSQGKFVGI